MIFTVNIITYNIILFVRSCETVLTRLTNLLFTARRAKRFTVLATIDSLLARFQQYEFLTSSECSDVIWFCRPIYGLVFFLSAGMNTALNILM